MDVFGYYEADIAVQAGTRIPTGTVVGVVQPNGNKGLPLFINIRANVQGPRGIAVGPTAD